MKRLKRKRHRKEETIPDKDDLQPCTSTTVQEENVNDDSMTDEKDEDESMESPWMNQKVIESKSREEEMEDYLNDLLL